MKKVDYFFCVLMALAATGHLFGTFKFFQFGTDIFVWSLSGVVAAALIVALNVMRILRPKDKALACVSFAACLSWIIIIILFGQTIGNFLDPRVLFHGISAAGLAFFSIRTLRKS